MFFLNQFGLKFRLWIFTPNTPAGCGTDLHTTVGPSGAMSGKLRGTTGTPGDPRPAPARAPPVSRATVSTTRPAPTERSGFCPMTTSSTIHRRIPDLT